MRSCKSKAELKQAKLATNMDIEQETWELIRIQQEYEAIYILLQHLKGIENDSGDYGPIYKIVTIPLGDVSQFNPNSFTPFSTVCKIWDALAYQKDGKKKVKFGTSMYLEIKPDGLRRQGLGTHLLSALAYWAKEIASDHIIDIHRKAISNESSAQRGVNSFYDQFCIFNGQIVANITIPSASEKVTVLDEYEERIAEIAQKYSYSEWESHREYLRGIGKDVIEMLKEDLRIRERSKNQR